MYVVQSSLQTDSPIMLINQHIGFDPDDGMGCSGPEFSRELLELDGMGFKCIQVWINSPGGGVMEGYNIYNAILKTKTPVDTYCIGMAASIAAVIFQAGRKRIMSDYGRLMFHNPSGGSKGTLDSIRGSIITMIASRSGKNEDEISAMMDNTAWVTPYESKESGLCDSIEYSDSHNIKHGNTKAFWKAANQVINSILKIENTMSETQVQAKVSMSLIANYLGLNTEATENSILSEVKNRINGETIAKETIAKELLDVKNKLDTTKNEKEAIQKKYDEKVVELTAIQNKIKTDGEAAEKKIKDAELETAKVKAKTMVEAHAKVGRIKNEAKVIDSWTEKATTDFDGVDSLLKDLPVNKNAVKIETSVIGDANDPNKVGMNAAGLMAIVQNNLKSVK